MYADGMLSSEEYLEHFGIRGMKWGVRRYQNEDGTLTEEGRRRMKELKYPAEPIDRTELESLGVKDNKIRKGSKMYRVADDGDIIDDRSKYTSMTQYDRESYREFAKMRGGLGNKDTNNVYEYTYETTRDISVAAGRQITDYVWNNYGDTKLETLAYDYREKYSKRAVAAMDAFFDAHGNEPISKFREDINLANNTRSFSESDKAYKKTLDMTTHATVLNFIDSQFLKSTLYMHGKPTEANLKMQKHFQDLGYQAMVDAEDAEWAEYPLIVFNPKEQIKQVNKRKL